MFQITKILNAHTDTLGWVDRNVGKLSNMYVYWCHSYYPECTFYRLWKVGGTMTKHVFKKISLRSLKCSNRAVHAQVPNQMHEWRLVFQIHHQVGQLDLILYHQWYFLYAYMTTQYVSMCVCMCGSLHMLCVCLSVSVCALAVMVFCTSNQSIYRMRISQYLLSTSCVHPDTNLVNLSGFD